MSKKVALISGITGQDSSYLAELLLEKGYEVHGVMRRSSYPNTQRIDHIFDPESKQFLHYGDLTEGIDNLLYDIKPDEVYNIGAQSHVKLSFDIPVYTLETNAVGVCRLLEGIRTGINNGILKKDIKVYQASSSEMFGTSPAPQNENTPFHPSSPYGAAKLCAYWLTRRYREGYNMFACNGILFNHETVAENMPVFIKKKGEDSFDIKPFEDILTFVNKDKQEYQSSEISGLEIWGKSGWTKVKYASAYPHKVKEDNKNPRIITGRCGSYTATGSHVAFLENGIEKETKDIKIGDSFEKVVLPITTTTEISLCNEEEAELIGYMVADGSITYSKKGIGIQCKFSKNNEVILTRFEELYSKVAGGKTLRTKAPSGFKKGNFTTQLILNTTEWLRNLDIYTNSHHKRIPFRVLNSSDSVQLSFLKAYNKGDGLKAGYGNREFKGFKTNSPTLAMGLWYLTDKLLPGQRKTLNTFFSDFGNLIYSFNLNAENSKQEKIDLIRSLNQQGFSQREIAKKLGIQCTSFIRKVINNSNINVKPYLERKDNEIFKTIDIPDYSGWFYDIETESGEFVAGVGNIHVHNSPRRGVNFVTRKITRIASKIKLGLADHIELGNLDAKRDWGHSKDYTRAMWMIMQHDKAEDWVVSTQETFTVREFAERVFKYFDLDFYKYLKFNDTYLRPVEVPALLGDSTKIRTILGWKPEYNIDMIIKEMCDNDYEETKRGMK